MLKLENIYLKLCVEVWLPCFFFVFSSFSFFKLVVIGMFELWLQSLGHHSESLVISWFS